MHFQSKIILKNNRYHNTKLALSSRIWILYYFDNFICIYGFFAQHLVVADLIELFVQFTNSKRKLCNNHVCVALKIKGNTAAIIIALICLVYHD
jgi:hypothetical protein